MNKTNNEFLLIPEDPVPVSWVNKELSSPVALVCEHAGNAVPHSLNQLGLRPDQLTGHTAIDIGAEATARLMTNELDCPLLMQRYSRLVIDCNRPPDAPDSIPVNSHGTIAPGNQALTRNQRACRVNEIFAPYDRALDDLTTASERQYVFSIHSFTPSLDNQVRPWDIGLLFRRDTQTSDRLYRYLIHNFPDLSIGLNQPYQIDDESDWFIPRYGERLGLRHCLIEIRNDHIRYASGQYRFASILTLAIQHVLSIV